jgi:hypothetical protein
MRNATTTTTTTRNETIAYLDTRNGAEICYHCFAVLKGHEEYAAKQEETFGADYTSKIVPVDGERADFFCADCHMELTAANLAY